MPVFRKEAAEPEIRVEVAGLRWLAEAGGAPVAQLVRVGPTWLETLRLAHSSPTPDDAARFGRTLAATHAAGAPWWGAPPPGTTVGLLAGLDAPVASHPRWASFGEFFAEARLEPYLRAARALDSTGRAVVARAIERIAAGGIDAAQPGLCRSSGATVARIHGDLWGGNVVWAAQSDRVVGTLIDPSAHGGHAETDLAELGVFHTPHLDAILAGYQEVSPLADGWRERVPAHQLHMLLVHVVLFGSSYASQAVALARLVA